MTPTSQEAASSTLRALFDAAVAAAQPAHVLARHLPERPNGRCVVVGAGKASAAMAAALEAAWPDVALEGVVVTRYGHAVPTTRIQILEAAHPVADANALVAGERLLAAVSGLGENDLVIALISGGGSALAVAPVAGVTLAQKQDLTRQLLRSGATIGEINLVRRALSRIKGGRLAAAAAPATVVTLVISDVPGDDPAIIASGPTVPGAPGPLTARAVIDRYGLSVPEPVLTALDTATPPKLATPPDVRMLATPRTMLEAAAAEARQMGLNPIILGDAIEGEASQLGTIMAGIATSARRHGVPIAAPAVILSGGETTVTIGKTSSGRGGRNLEFLLALALKLDGQPEIFALAADTDGIDGTENAAGAIIDPTTLDRARAVGLDPRAALAVHDSYSVFERLGDLVVTGPTLTNVNDFRAILVSPD